MDLPFQVWVQIIINGLSMGGLYVLIALGLTLILSIMGILQLAHGEVYMLGAYAVYYIAVKIGINVYGAILISMFLMAGFGILMEKFLFRRCEDKVLSPIIISTGLTLILQSGAVIAFGLYERSIPRLSQGSFELMGIFVPRDRIVAMIISTCMAYLLYLFLKKSKLGLGMVASAQNPKGAQLKGIDPNKMSLLAMAIGSGFAAVGGAMAGSILMLTPFMGTLPLVKGLAIIVLGGMGSLSGAVFGGILIGLIDGIVPVVFGPLTASLAPLVIVIIVLLIKPQGLFGHE